MRLILLIQQQVYWVSGAPSDSMQVLTTNAGGEPAMMVIALDKPGQAIVSQGHPEFPMTDRSQHDQMFYIEDHPVVVPAGTHAAYAGMVRHFVADQFDELTKQYLFTSGDVNALLDPRRLTHHLGKTFYSRVLSYMAVQHLGS